MHLCRKYILYAFSGKAWSMWLAMLVTVTVSRNILSQVCKIGKMCQWRDSRPCVCHSTLRTVRTTTAHTWAPSKQNWFFIKTKTWRSAPSTPIVATRGHKNQEKRVWHVSESRGYWTRLLFATIAIWLGIHFDVWCSVEANITAVLPRFSYGARVTWGWRHNTTSEWSPCSQCDYIDTKPLPFILPCHLLSNCK